MFGASVISNLPVSPKGEISFLFGDKVVKKEELEKRKAAILSPSKDVIDRSQIVMLQSLSGSGKTKLIMYLAITGACWVIQINCDQASFLKEEMESLSKPFLVGHIPKRKHFSLVISPFRNSDYGTQFKGLRRFGNKLTQGLPSI
jgi:hypothetical protein